MTQLDFGEAVLCELQINEIIIGRVVSMDRKKIIYALHLAREITADIKKLWKVSAI